MSHDAKLGRWVVLNQEDADHVRHISNALRSRRHQPPKLGAAASAGLLMSSPGGAAKAQAALGFSGLAAR